MSCTLALNAHCAERQAQTLEPRGRESEKSNLKGERWRRAGLSLRQTKRDCWFVERLIALRTSDWIPDRTEQQIWNFLFFFFFKHRFFFLFFLCIRNQWQWALSSKGTGIFLLIAWAGRGPPQMMATTRGCWRLRMAEKVPAGWLIIKFYFNSRFLCLWLRWGKACFFSGKIFHVCRKSFKEVGSCISVVWHVILWINMWIKKSILEEMLNVRCREPFCCSVKWEFCLVWLDSAFQCLQWDTPIFQCGGSLLSF